MVTFPMTERKALCVGESVGPSELNDVFPDHNFVYRKEVTGANFDSINIDTDRGDSGAHLFLFFLREL